MLILISSKEKKFKTIIIKCYKTVFFYNINRDLRHLIRWIPNRGKTKLKL